MPQGATVYIINLANWYVQHAFVCFSMTQVFFSKIQYICVIE